MTATSKDNSVHVTDERINTISHLVGACFALLGASLLITQAASEGDPWTIVGVSIYSASLLTLFTCSTLHHGLDLSPRTNDILRTLDYTSVFFLIAGSVTPIVLVLSRTTYGWAVLGAVWAVAIAGIVGRSVWRDLPKWVTNTLFIVLGWMPVVLVFGGISVPFGALALMAAGGILYSIGFVIFIIEKPNPIPGIFGFHEIWHLIVLVAATLHFIMIYIYVL